MAPSPKRPAPAVECDVAVVGCGPTGVVLTALLAQAGLTVHVCDRLPGVYDLPRAITLDHEILRLFQQLCVVEQVEPFVEPYTPSEYLGADGQLIRRLAMAKPPYPQGYTPSVVFSQPPVERVLRERAASLPGVTMALGLETTGFAQDAQGVTLEHADGRRVRARYAVACDGGSSGMRQQLGIELEDLAFDEPWLVADVLVNESGLARLPINSVHYCEPERPCAMVIGPKNHRRWEFSLQPGEDPAHAATPQATWQLLSRWLSPADGTLWRQSSYRFHALVAKRWRVGRCFVAGDAAHMQPPFLGQGMCQGLRDAANLAWKLVAVLREGAPERLLDSYGEERGAHVRELTERVKQVGALIGERDPAKARERDRRLLQETGGVVRDTPRQDLLPPLSTGLLFDTPGAGTLFPQPRFTDGTLMDWRCGHGWRLVHDGTLDLAPPPPAVRPVDFTRGDTAEADSVVASWMRRHQCRAALVRPDHYVFGTAAGAAGVEWMLQARGRALVP